MSIGINGVPGKIPAIQKTHQTNDGGAGNTGYFGGERKNGKKKERSDEISFGFGESNDIFISDTEEKTLGELIKNLLSEIKVFIKNI